MDKDEKKESMRQIERRDRKEHGEGKKTRRVDRGEKRERT